MPAPEPTDADYRRLLEFRTGLRQFLRWSEALANAAGVSAAQHQLMLAIRGHPDPRGPTIGEAAEYLLLRHHSAVGLVNRAQAAGLVVRVPDADDHRVVRLALTETAQELLAGLVGQTFEEITELVARLELLRTGLEADRHT